MEKDKIDMWTEMFGDNPEMRQAAAMMNPENVAIVYNVWLENGKDSNIALGYIFGRSAAIMEDR